MTIFVNDCVKDGVGDSDGVSVSVMVFDMDFRDCIPMLDSRSIGISIDFSSSVYLEVYF